MGLGPAKSSALSVLVFGGPRSLGELAAAEGVKPPSMTRVVQELEAEGLVRRRTDERDRRAVRLEATARANRILKEGRARRAALLAEWLEQLDEREVAKIAEALPVLEKTSEVILVSSRAKLPRRSFRPQRSGRIDPHRARGRRPRRQ